MKIGIITFHNVENYGAVLQVYGLQYTLAKLGYEPYVVDYRNYKVSEKMFTTHRFLSNPVKYGLLYFLYSRSVKEKEKKFSSFVKSYLNIMGENIQAQNIKDLKLDYYIVGSDQIWNPRITGGYDGVYWGDKDIYRDSKVIAYAASGKAEYILELNKELLSNSLNNLKHISVREDKIQQLLRTDFNLSSYLVLDPTLLAGRDCFNRIACNRLIKDNYILFYNVEGRKDALKKAKEIARVKKTKLVVLGTSHFFKRAIQHNVIYYNASVIEMLSLIKYSEAVIALSFHGTALAIIFEKEFYSLEGGNMDRVESLLLKIGLANRIFYSDKPINVTPVEYETANLKLDSLREESIEYLKNSLV